ncbi:MAG TPA: XrtA system polysaccharide deacetylase [Acetobacteraceae bacterium]|nr:XrtA system polysaccharide deacetylase [Acetobacteraceae bacterium]
MTPAANPGTATRNAMTVDVEDYFQVQAFAHCISRASWETTPRRVEANVDRILAQFAAAGVRATFFTLGWIAERHPAMVRSIVGEGHELASHGWDHTRADAQDPPTFRADVGRTRRTLEDIGGVPVAGYRAATFSIGARNRWAFTILESEGYRYSSSINPVRHDLYGRLPDAPRAPFRPDGGALWEIPMTTLRLAGRNLPCSGGGYFRLLPYRLFRLALSHVNRTERRPGVFYFHPWEIDPGQPRIAGCGWKSRLRHTINLERTAGRLEHLLRDFSWDRMDAAFADLLSEPVLHRELQPELPA